MMQPITTKELNYVTDSLANEDLIMKHCATLAASTQHAGTQSLCMSILNEHNQHVHTLLHTLHNHLPMAPAQPTN